MNAKNLTRASIGVTAAATVAVLIWGSQHSSSAHPPQGETVTIPTTHHGETVATPVFNQFLPQLHGDPTDVFPRLPLANDGQPA